ncbi:unnamed protein product [Camellia sinensis]
MKIQCDVCKKDEASVFCSADEAALCAACDHRVHHANKLAGKHQRFALQHPSPKQFPLCDICQEKRAFLFCQQDRAILCRNCDISIHEANEHTRNHDRFLLTGVKLSATSSLYSSQSSSDSSAANNDLLPNLKSQNSIATTTNSNKPIALQPTIAKTVTAETVVATTANKGVEGGAATSSISEYLTETLPGWRVDDFLDSSSPTSFGIYKTVVDEVMPLWDGDLESNLGSFSSPNNVGIWVPQAPPPQYPHQYSSPNMGFGNQIGFKESKEATINKNKNNNNDNNNKSGRKWRDGGCFIVPQISPSSIAASKRSRTYR